MNAIVMVRFFKGGKLKRTVEYACASGLDAELAKLAFTVMFAVPIAEGKVLVSIDDSNLTAI